MRSDDDPDTVERHDDDETSYDVGADRRGPGSLFPYPPVGWWSLGSADEEANEGYEVPESDAADDTWADEGLISLLILAGVVLFLIPEPATSFVGILLVLAGAVLWIIDWMI